MQSLQDQMIIVQNYYHYKSTQNMQFTEIRQISNLFNDNSQLPHQYTSNKLFFDAFRQRFLNQRQFNQDELEYSQAMRDLNEIIVNQSYMHNLQDEDGLFGIQKFTQNGSSKQQSVKDKQNQSSSSTFDNQNYKKYDKTKSIIFHSSLSNKRSLTSTSMQKRQNCIKVFCFDQPIFKFISFDPKTTIRQIVEKALELFANQNKFNQTHHRALKPFHMYEMRLPQTQSSFKSDKTSEPIDFDRIISDNLFQTLVLVEKQIKFDSLSPFRKSTKQDSSSFFPTYRKSRASLESLNSLPNKSITITLVNQAFFELAQIQLHQNQTLEKIFDLIQQNNLHEFRNFLITQDSNSDFSLPRDFQVKNLQSSTLFVKIKKFADQASDQKQLVVRPMRLNTIFPRQINYFPPIGINEASKYEEFDVIKINKLGIAQQRVLGIDQMKLYNYQRNIRKQKKQITIFSKFIGLNNITGTKKPFRLIKDIKQIKKFNGGLLICFAQKQITYIVKQEHKKEQIIRKLNFLMTLNTASEKLVKSQTQVTY